MRLRAREGHGVKKAIGAERVGAFPLSLMQPAARCHGEALSGVTINTPVVPGRGQVHSAAPTSDPDTIRQNLVRPGERAPRFALDRERAIYGRSGRSPPAHAEAGRRQGAGPSCSAVSKKSLEWFHISDTRGFEAFAAFIKGEAHV